MLGRTVVGTVIICLGVYACRQADAAKSNRADSTKLAEREARLTAALGRSDSTVVDSGVVADTNSADTAAKKGAADKSGGALARWVLPQELDEISGLTLTPDGRLLAHGDERAQISEIDYRRGVIVKQFVVGSPTIRDDIEAIAAANDVVFLMASNGKLYEFREGRNGERVDYTTYDTRLGKECEFEGLAFDSTLNSLVLACKNVQIKKLRDSLVLYRWKLQGVGERMSQLVVPLEGILKMIGEKELHPSDIAVDPKTGNYVIIASIEEAMVEITPSGEVVFARRLTGEHWQPESLAITKDNILIIGDEASKRPAIITLYRWP